MTTIKNLSKKIDKVSDQSERNRILIEGVDGDNGIKGKMLQMNGAIQNKHEQLDKDIKNLGDTFRKLDKKLTWIIGLLVGAGVFEGIFKMLGTG